MLRQFSRSGTGEPDLYKTAWKTGTSWGFHDAWTVGVCGNNVLAVLNIFDTLNYMSRMEIKI